VAPGTFADDEDSQKPIVNHLPKVDPRPARQDARLKYWEVCSQNSHMIARAELIARAANQLRHLPAPDSVLIAISGFRDLRRFRPLRQPSSGRDLATTRSTLSARSRLTKLLALCTLPTLLHGRGMICAPGEARLHTLPKSRWRSRRIKTAVKPTQHPNQPVLNNTTPFQRMPGVFTAVSRRSAELHRRRSRHSLLSCTLYGELFEIHAKRNTFRAAVTTLSAKDLPDGAPPIFF